MTENILNDGYYYFLSDNKNVSFYSLTIGLEEYFETYHKGFSGLSDQHIGDVTKINDVMDKENEYVKCYLNVAIHIQHFFEMEIKRILEENNILYAIDYSSDILILSKVLSGNELSDSDLRKKKSVEFSEAIERLCKLVNNNVISDEVSVLFTNNKKILCALNQMRNTILHRGKRIMHYCDLDALFVCEVLPLIKDVIECNSYKEILSQYRLMGIYDAIKNLIAYGKTNPLDYSRIAYEKEMARCSIIVNRKEISKGDEKSTSAIIEIGKHDGLCVSAEYKNNMECPCCKNKSMFLCHELVGFFMDELGDETSTVGGCMPINVPEYTHYYECGICSFTYNDFINV